MYKRKREDECYSKSFSVQRLGELFSVLQPRLIQTLSQAPSKSPRLQQQQQQPQPLPSPSPSSSYFVPDNSSNKRKYIYEDAEEPSPKQLKTSDQSKEPGLKQADPLEEAGTLNQTETPEQAEIQEHPVEYWTEHHRWPHRYADGPFVMPSHEQASSSSQKRPRTNSYSQSVKEGEVPRQYTSAYEKWVAGRGLKMDIVLGSRFVSQDSQDLCDELQQPEYTSIAPTLFPQEHILSVIQHYRARKEGPVNRDVTPLIIPPILALYLHGEAYLEHVLDEVRVDWMQNCVLAGPVPQPDLAIGLSASAFTQLELDKLNSYKSMDNWAAFTEDLFFPALLCEVKSGREALSVADRQNMHSCSVALRAILRIVQEADRYRPSKEFHNLSGKILVFSISHDQKDVRLYGHFAKLDGPVWEYYRHEINTYNLYKERDRIAIYNFVRRVLKLHFPNHIKRIKEALSALPDPSTVSMTTSEMNLDGDSQQLSQPELAAGNEAAVFKVPTLPASAMAEIEKIRVDAEERSEQREKEREKKAEEREKEREKKAEEREREREQKAEAREKERQKERHEFNEREQQLLRQMDILLQRLDQNK